VIYSILYIIVGCITFTHATYVVILQSQLYNLLPILNTVWQQNSTQPVRDIMIHTHHWQKQMWVVDSLKVSAIRFL